MEEPEGYSALSQQILATCSNFLPWVCFTVATKSPWCLVNRLGRSPARGFDRTEDEQQGQQEYDHEERGDGLRRKAALDVQEGHSYGLSDMIKDNCEKEANGDAESTPHHYSQKRADRLVQLRCAKERKTSHKANQGIPYNERPIGVRVRCVKRDTIQ